jgi:hypothetical protein
MRTDPRPGKLYELKLGFSHLTRLPPARPWQEALCCFKHIFDCFVAQESYTFAVLANENVCGTDLIRFASPKNTVFN